jgi:hypothetical protein
VIVPNCTFSGILERSEVWNKSQCDPFVMVGDTTVPSGLRLTLLPGVRIQVQSTYAALIVRGELVADGQGGDWIEFTSVSRLLGRAALRDHGGGQSSAEQQRSLSVRLVVAALSIGERAGCKACPATWPC